MSSKPEDPFWAMLSSRGGMGARIDSYPWHKTHLGSPHDWPQSLRYALSVCLNSPSPIAIFWGGECIFFYNDPVSRLLGDKHPDALGRPAASVFPEIWDKVGPFLHTIFTCGEAKVAMDPALQLTTRRAGNERYFECTYSPISRKDGSVGGILKIAFDATERVLGERELRASEARYRAFLNATANSLYRISADGKTLLEVSGSLMEAHDTITASSIVPFQECIHPEDRMEAYTGWMEAVKAGRCYEKELRVRRPDGSFVWALTRAVPVRDEGGQIIEWLGAVTDITEKRNAEEQLRRNERRLTAILEQLPVGVGLYDHDGRMIISNSLQRSFVGSIMPSRDPESSRYWRAYGADGRILERSQYPSARALRGETVSPGIDFVRTYEDGRELWTRVSSAPFLDETGNIAGAVSVTQDIDDEKLTQEANLVLIAELQHRTRNLMAVVRSIANQVLKSSSSRKDFTARLNDRLGALSRVQGLLSRPTSSVVLIRQLIATELAALGTDENDVRIRLEGPDVALPFNVVQTLALALHELSTNALKYGALSTSAGRLEISWRVFAEKQDESRLELIWVERGVAPKVKSTESARYGFGRELIERALPYQFRTNTKFEITAQGVYCVIDLPLANRDTKSP